MTARDVPIVGPRLIILTLLFVLPIVPPETRGEAMAGCAILVGLLALLTWRLHPDQHTGQVLLVVVAALAVPAAWAAMVPAAAVEPVTLTILACACGLAAFGLRGDERLGQHAVTVVAFVATWVAAHAIYQKLWGLRALTEAVQNDPSLPDRTALLIRLGAGRSFAGFATPAALGGFLAVSMPMTVGLALAAEGRRRRVLFALAAVQLAGFVLAASATAAAALMGAFLIAALVWGHARRLLLAGVAVLVVVLAVVAVTRGEKVLRLDSDSPWRLRAGNVRSAWTMAGDHPWTGVGPGGFSEMYPGYRRSGDNEVRHAHNLPLELAAELGWPAAALVCGMFFWLFFRPLWAERRAGAAWRQGAALGLFALALQNLVDFTAYMPSLLWMAALMAGLLAPVRGRPRSDRERPAPSIMAGVSLAVVFVAVVLGVLSGLAWNSRIAARRAVFAGENGRALELADRAAGLAPWDIEAALLLARLKVQRAAETGSLDEALEQANRVVGLAPVRPAARELRASLRLRTGDAPGALADLTEAARLYPLHDAYARSRDMLRQGLDPDR